MGNELSSTGLYTDTTVQNFVLFCYCAHQALHRVEERDLPLDVIPIGMIPLLPPTLDRVEVGAILLVERAGAAYAALEFLVPLLLGIPVRAELLEEGPVRTAAPPGRAEGLSLVVVDGGFLVVGNAIGRG